MPLNNAGSDRPLPPPVVTAPPSRSYARRPAPGRLAPPFVRGRPAETAAAAHRFTFVDVDPEPGQTDALHAETPYETGDLPPGGASLPDDDLLDLAALEAPAWFDADLAEHSPLDAEDEASAWLAAGFALVDEGGSGESEAHESDAADGATPVAAAADSWDQEDPQPGSAPAPMTPAAGAAAPEPDDLGVDAAAALMAAAPRPTIVPPSLEAFRVASTPDLLPVHAPGEGRDVAERVARQLDELSRDLRENGMAALGKRTSTGELARLIAAVVAGFIARDH
jgi:hypothetical protein